MEQRHTSLCLIAAILGCVAVSGCAASDSAGAVFPTAIGDENAPKDELSAQALLVQHDIAGARDAFEINRGADPGTSAAGVALTSILLLPYTDAATRIIVDHLGGNSAMDAQGDVIWGDEGFVFFVARGVPWDDSPTTAGIRTLIADRMPWSHQALGSVDAFVSGLDNPFSMLMDDAVALTVELGVIAENLDDAVQSADFDTIFIPGEVFHDDSLDLVLGKPELAFLQASAHALSAAIHFTSAYRHAWTLERALGTSIWDETISDPQSPGHIPGGEALDYQVAHVNESLFRVLEVQERLQDARDATAATFRAIAAGTTRRSRVV